jgi:uncharacterized membrane protein YtjA (UPF0391 family)
MLRLAVLFFIIALIAGLFGFGLVAGVAYDAARIFFFVFLVLAILSLLFGAFRGAAPPPPV